MKKKWLPTYLGESFKYPYLWYASIFFLSACTISRAKVSDAEGNTYGIRKFKNVWWMTENLRTTKDTEGENITYFIPNKDKANIKNYGLLYDYEVACNVCPKGWELPTIADWDKLIQEESGKKSSSFKDLEYWKNEKATPENGFSIRPSGYGNSGEHPNFFKERSILWSRSSSEEFGLAMVFEMNNDHVRKAEQHKTYGFSVRCIKK